MTRRACISINNRCNLNCIYCHFHEKRDTIHEEQMDVKQILDNITEYIDRYELSKFKLGFVGNGEPLLDYDKLKEYILYIDKYIQLGIIEVYTITNGLLMDSEKIRFFKEHKIKVGFSLDGIESVHNKYRCGTYNIVMKKMELYREICGTYPSINCTIGKESIEKAEELIAFFQKFNTKITFSRMIGKYQITLDEYRDFIEKARERLEIRIGGYDCTMYGGMCGAGKDNIFYANNKVFICGNCIDLPYSYPAKLPLDEIEFDIEEFDRKSCFREVEYR